MMKPIPSAILALCLAQGGWLPARAADLPRPETLTRAVINHLPQKPVILTGRLTADRAATGTVSTLGIEILITATNGQVFGRYTLTDSFGDQTEQLTVTRQLDAPAVTRYWVGHPPVETNLTDLFQIVNHSEISWMDLTLGFLWWPAGATIGKEEVKGQMCYVVDMLSPTPARNRYATMRIWIEERVGMLLQAEAYNPNGDLVRRMSIKSFKKIDDQWMIKDLELRTFPDGTRTHLRIDEVRPVDRAEGESPPEPGAATNAPAAP